MQAPTEKRDESDTATFNSDGMTTRTYILCDAKKTSQALSRINLIALLSA